MFVSQELPLLRGFAEADGAGATSGRLMTDGLELIDMRRVIGIATWNKERTLCYVWFPQHPVGRFLVVELVRVGATWLNGQTGELMSGTEGMSDKDELFSMVTMMQKLFPQQALERWARIATDLVKEGDVDEDQYRLIIDFLDGWHRLVKLDVPVEVQEAGDVPF